MSRPSRTRRGQQPHRRSTEEAVRAARNELRRLSTAELIAVHDLLERLLNSDDLSVEDVEQLKRLLAERGEP